MAQTIALIAPSSVPFQLGGAESFWWGLHRALLEHTGAAVELIKIPAPEANFQQLVASYKAFSELDVSHFSLIITSKYPAWMVHHDFHVLYMQHTLRGLYDTYHLTGLPETLDPIPEKLVDLVQLLRKQSPSRADLPEAFDRLHKAYAIRSLPSSLFAFPGPLLRETIHFFDRIALSPREITAYAAISRTVANRQDYFPPDVAQRICILHHPTNLTPCHTDTGQTDAPCFFTASRLNGTKRIALLIAAMRFVEADIPLFIAGTGPDREELADLAAADARIHFLGHVPDNDLAAWYAKALCVPFVPYDEDYGLITVEAMNAGKAVVTCRDSGGVCEMVEDGVTGLIAEPNPESLGHALETIARDRDRARAMGENARRQIASLSWKNTAQALLAHAEHSRLRFARDPGRKKIVVVSTFPLKEPYFGGQRRLHALCATLAKQYKVILICYAQREKGCAATEEILPNCFQQAIPWSDNERERIEELTKKLGVSADDLGILESCASDSTFLDALRAHNDAVACIASHPYTYPAIEASLKEIPLVYDAHNVEADLKASVLADKANDILDRVIATEGRCAKNAEYIITCSDEATDRFASLYAIEKERCVCIPNGYDAKSLAYFGRRERRALRKRLPYPSLPIALFLGSEHKPNTDAVFFLEDIAKELTTVEFLIAGGVSLQDCVQERAFPQNMHRIGIISEGVKNTLLHAVDVGLNPVTSGSGTNLKSVEYIAAGVPCVATPFGLRGLNPETTAVVRTAEPKEFRDAIHTLLSNPPEERLLAKCAQKAREYYSWEACMRPLIPLLSTIEGKTQPSIN